MSEPVHDETLINTYIERVSALSISAFDGADVSRELKQVVQEAVAQCGASKTAPSGNNLQVLTARLQQRADAAEKEAQPQVRNTFAEAAKIAGAR